MTSEAKKEVERLVHEGQKIKAVQYLHTAYNISLQDARLLVDTLEAEIATRPGDPSRYDFTSANTAVLVGLGVIGTAFGLISIVFVYFARRKF